jgi:hypothetical protein
LYVVETQGRRITRFKTPSRSRAPTARSGAIASPRFAHPRPWHSRADGGPVHCIRNGRGELFVI